jgi:hypothetical protein
MNNQQDLWWQQANSDYELFDRLRRDRHNACHILHYLQMATEKLSKAYLWRSGHAPPRNHTGFVRFLRALRDRNEADLQRITELFGFGRSGEFVTWIRSVLPLAYQLQNIAPAEAGDGPNPEYPWPHALPVSTPVTHTFGLWTELAETGRGGHLLDFIERAIRNFAAYA